MKPHIIIIYETKIFLRPPEIQDLAQRDATLPLTPNETNRQRWYLNFDAYPSR